jgi:hypothetical protein
LIGLLGLVFERPTTKRALDCTATGISHYTQQRTCITHWQTKSTWIKHDDPLSHVELQLHFIRNAWTTGTSSRTGYAMPKSSDLFSDLWLAFLNIFWRNYRIITKFDTNITTLEAKPTSYFWFLTVNKTNMATVRTSEMGALLNTINLKFSVTIHVPKICNFC